VMDGWMEEWVNISTYIYRWIVVIDCK
jgi:hypothetical protein